MKISLFQHKNDQQEQPAEIRDVLWQNEVYANRLTAIAMGVCSCILLLCMAFTATGVFTENPAVMYGTCVAALVWHLLPAVISFCNKNAKPWIKYMLLTCLIIGQARVDCGLGYHVILCIVLPVVFSTRYYSRRLTLFMAGVTTVIFAITTYVGAVTGFTPANLNFAGEGAEYARNIMVQSFFPKWMVFALVSGICVEIATQGRNMVAKQARISQEHSRVETELRTASQIQLHTLPNPDKILAGSEATFDLATSIIPAKEVGGDFYDFFYIDPTHLALVIADVSGKGVPAALLMMVSKVLLDAGATVDRTPAEVLATANRQLCEKNINDMFVTVWLGILDLTTGELVCANAGHENPIVCRRDGTVEVFKTKHGMVLGGIDCARYRDEVIRLMPGDAIFVYTDGIPEAHNTASEMFGMERLKEVLKGQEQTALPIMLALVQQQVNSFAGDAPQFDDSTMMALRLNKLKPVQEKRE